MRQPKRQKLGRAARRKGASLAKAPASLATAVNPAPPRGPLSVLGHAVVALARGGAHYAKDAYDAHRYARLAELGADVLAHATDAARSTWQARMAREAVPMTAKMGVAAAVWHADGRLALVQRADTGEWTMPGGWAEVGEMPAMTAVRETREECGLEVSAQRLLGVWDSRVWPYHSPLHLYHAVVACTLVPGTAGAPRVASAEIQRAAWFDLAGATAAHLATFATRPDSHGAPLAPGHIGPVLHALATRADPALPPHLDGTSVPAA